MRFLLLPGNFRGAFGNQKHHAYPRVLLSIIPLNSKGKVKSMYVLKIFFVQLFSTLFSFFGQQLFATQNHTTFKNDVFFSIVFFVSGRVNKLNRKSGVWWSSAMKQSKLLCNGQK
jgi:hypothetical protein